jgi:site-specific DNA recombinase
MKAAIYARVSTEDQAGDDRFSLSSQLDECRQYADEKGYEVVAEFVDEFTGTLPNRPELDRLRQLFGSTDVVLVHNPDRLSRDAVDLLMLEREFREAGSPIEFLHVSYDTNTSIGQLMLFLEGVNAQEYRRTMLEQTARGKRQKAKEGQILFAGFEPYGYRRGTDQHGKAIAEIVTEEAEIVRLIFHWYVNGDENGSSMGDTLIAMRLTEMQVPCKRQDMGSNRRKNANVWESKTIASILKNELYIGVWHYNKTKAVGKPNAKGKRTKRALRPE